MSFIELCEALWSNFFPKDKFNKQDARIHPIELFLNAFERNNEIWSSQSPLERKFVTFRLEDLRSCLNFHDFDATLINQPCEVLGSLGIAISVAVYRRSSQATAHHTVDNPRFSIVPIHVRVTNIGNPINYSEIKSSKVGQLISISGYVTKISPIRPLVQYAKFLCAKCMSLQSVYQEDGVFNPPSSCSTTQCRNKYLELQRHGVVTVPYQRIKIQEADDSSDESARVPRSFDLEMRAELVNQCRAGDFITAVGIVSTSQVGCHPDLL
jgi:DNA replicative helicase MCM subunit Mcm2 (Cdc46/Mcm family)